jgi:hypothetical protein
MGIVTARGTLLVAGLLLVVLSGAACRDGTTKQSAPAAEGAVNPADFSAKVDHPLLSLVSVRSQTFEGTERDPKGGETIKTRMEKQVLDQPEKVAGVEVTALEVKEYEDGELVERTLDYFAQHRDGSVWYFGERIDDYEDGKVTGHEGQWLAGEGNARPGLYLPADPVVGQEFAQEQVPGVAEDRSTILAVGAEVTTPAGRFTGCIRVKDYAPLTKTEEFKFYCPKVGIVREKRPTPRPISCATADRS